jgi:glycosyltransferase involved in cell wall biosynthesis
VSSTRTRPTISIVVPTLNEARNLEVVLPGLPPADEVIVVDGGSTDDTVAVARRLMPDAVIIQQTRRGKGNALACGFAAATGDIIVMFDADGSADPAEIAAFVDALLAGADFAKGSRLMRGGGSEDLTPLRKVGNVALTKMTNLFFSVSYSDLCYGYNAFWRDVLPVLDLPDTQPAHGRRWGDGFEIETLINCRVAAANLKVAEIPSIERLRIHGESNLNPVTDGIRVLKTMLTERDWRTPDRPSRHTPAVIDLRDPVAATAPVPVEVPA